jgi:hypothetical protein
VKFQPQSRLLYWLFPITGLAALVWFAVRVLPKPSRAAYPCQQVAAPIASAFLAWVVGIGVSVFALRKARRYIFQSRFLIGAGCIVAAAAAFFLTTLQTAKESYSQTNNLGAAVAVPLGTAKGTIPGRVVWAWDPAATNEYCNNNAGNYWWSDNNTDQAVVERMLSKSLQQLTGTSTDAAAWTAIFKYYNAQKRNLPNTGYQAGEKIAIKINLCSAFGMTPPSQGGSYTKGVYSYGDYRAMTDVSPQMIKALLKSLTTIAGVSQANISIGDPNRPFFDQFFNMIRPSFPSVKYLDPWGLNGRTLTAPTASNVLFYSDRDGTQAVSDKLPQAFVDASYMINLAALKCHESAGITLCAKNHFGSQCRKNTNGTGQGSAMHLHYALPESFNSPGYKRYRPVVDMMGHRHLGGKTMLNIVDGLWGGYMSIPLKPNKWVSSPFNNDWPSSLLLSQDPVAIDAVGFDFLKNEYQAANGYAADHSWPNSTVGVDDYLLQAASPGQWPATWNGKAFAGYDPEKDGSLLTSLGVYDHWKSVSSKWYSKNLNPSLTNGIALFKVPADGRQTVFAVNCGGGLYTATNGTVYQADINYTGGTVATFASAISGTSNPFLYQSERWGACAYAIPGLASGTYSIRFHFAETYMSAAGKRTFNVAVENKTVISKLDLYLAVGKNAAYDITKTVTVSDGTLNINFTNATADQPKICAFAVSRVINSANQAPLAKAGADRTTTVNTKITLDGRTSKDPDNLPSALTFNWSQIGGPAVKLSSATTSLPSFTPTVAGSCTFRLTVKDGGKTASDDVVITVK